MQRDPLEPAPPAGLAVREATHVDMSSAEYHAHDAVGASALETFRDSRRTYYARYVAKTEPSPEPTAAMKLGTCVHLRLLEPARFRAEAGEPMPAKAPGGEDWNMRKPSHREAWTAEEAARGGHALDDATRARIEAIAASVLGNWHARRLLERDGVPEYSIFWTDKETGLACKCRVDWWSTLPLDIKTTRDPAPAAFARQCVELGYHRKRAHYMAGIRAFTGDKDIPLVHLAVGTEPHYPCCPYDLDDADVNGKSLGARQWRQTLQDLAECLVNGDWSEPYEKQIVSLRLPSYAFHADEFSVL